MFGKPGNGKSFFIKEIIKNCNFPTFIFKGEGKEMADSIYEIVRIARKYSQSIIVFDELDLLINKQERVMRAQQECLDGVESFDDILVLAATNDLYEIPDALIRHRRLEKLISIPYPMEEEAYEMLEYYFQEFNIKLSDDIDKDEISSLLTRFTCAAIKSIANETVLKNGFENITTEMIEDSIYSALDRIKDSPRENNFEVVVHEAGHGAAAYSFPDFFIVNRMNINPLGGYFHTKEVNAGYLPYNKMIADIKISMAGILSEKIICGVGSNGREEDLQKARKYVYNMFNMSGYSSCWETLPAVSGDTRTETFIKRRKTERKIEA